jgi:hypothetical protein
MRQRWGENVAGGLVVVPKKRKKNKEGSKAGQYGKGRPKDKVTQASSSDDSELTQVKKPKGTGKK